MKDPIKMVSKYGNIGQLLVGLFSGLGTLSILLADSWYHLAFGWTALLAVIVGTIFQRQTVVKPEGKCLLELGPPVHQIKPTSNKVLIPLGFFVILLGIGGLLMTNSDEKSLDTVPNGLFLIGAGVCCIAIPSARREFLSLGYLFWVAAGAVMVVSSITWADNNIALSRGLTLGIVVLLVGAVAAYAFLFVKTRIYSNGLAIGRRLVPWNNLRSWMLSEQADGITILQVNYKDSPATIHAVVPRKVIEELAMILTANLGETSAEM